jgi:hypothetical protein
MSWYTAVLVVSSSIKDAEDYAPLIDLQFRLIRAPDPESAYQSALELGAKENQVYKNEDGQEVEWSFQGLNDLRELDGSKIVSGMEVYSRILQGNRNELVVSKEELSVFWEERNKHKTAKEILEEK